MPLGKEVGLGPGHIVLDGDPVGTQTPQQPLPTFGSCLLWPNGGPSQQLLSSCFLFLSPCSRQSWLYLPACQPAHAKHFIYDIALSSAFSPYKLTRTRTIPLYVGDRRHPDVFLLSFRQTKPIVDRCGTGLQSVGDFPTVRAYFPCYCRPLAPSSGRSSRHCVIIHAPSIQLLSASASC